MSTSRREDTIPPSTPLPLPVPSTTVIGVGLTVWVVALIVTLVVPSLHEGTRDWWPWTCVTGIGLGLFGMTYVRLGRGSAPPRAAGGNPHRYY